MPDKKEFPHVLEIRSREPFSELLSQPGRKLLQQLDAVPSRFSLSARAPRCPADLEVRQHLENVDRAGSSVAARLDEIANLGDESAARSSCFPFTRTARFEVAAFFFIGSGSHELRVWSIRRGSNLSHERFGVF